MRVHGSGVGERVRKWMELAAKKKGVEESRNSLLWFSCWSFLAFPWNSCFSWAFMKGSRNMNSLVGFGSVAAFILSANAGNGSWVHASWTFSERARIKASSDMNELLLLVSTQARLVITSSVSDSSAKAVVSSNSICMEVPIDDIRIGDSVLVLPGETIPVDGKVLTGRSVVDESMLTCFQGGRTFSGSWHNKLEVLEGGVAVAVEMAARLTKCGYGGACMGVE